MALTSTIFNFEIDLSDSDRGVYESLSLRVARHPSESDEFLVARVFAYCLEYQDGIEFSRGLSDPDDPPIAVKDLTGTLRAWIDVGTPSAERLHRAAKAAPRVAVYVHKDPTQWLAGLAGARIHRAGDIAVRVFDRQLIADLVAALERRLSFALAVTDNELFVSFDDRTMSASMRAVSL